MAHCREEGGFGLECRLRPVLGLSQAKFEHLALVNVHRRTRHREASTCGGASADEAGFQYPYIEPLCIEVAMLAEPFIDGAVGASTQGFLNVLQVIWVHSAEPVARAFFEVVTFLAQNAIAGCIHLQLIALKVPLPPYHACGAHGTSPTRTHLAGFRDVGVS